MEVFKYDVTSGGFTHVAELSIFYKDGDPVMVEYYCNGVSWFRGEEEAAFVAALTGETFDLYVQTMLVIVGYGDCPAFPVTIGRH